MYDEVKKTVETLLRKAISKEPDAQGCDAALKYTQAAVNAANAGLTLETLRIRREAGIP